MINDLTQPGAAPAGATAAAGNTNTSGSNSGSTNTADNGSGSTNSTDNGSGSSNSTDNGSGSTNSTDNSSGSTNSTGSTTDPLINSNWSGGDYGTVRHVDLTDGSGHYLPPLGESNLMLGRVEDKSGAVHEVIVDRNNVQNNGFQVVYDMGTQSNAQPLNANTTYSPEGLSLQPTWFGEVYTMTPDAALPDNGNGTGLPTPGGYGNPFGGNYGGLGNPFGGNNGGFGNPFGGNNGTPWGNFNPWGNLFGYGNNPSGNNSSGGNNSGGNNSSGNGNNSSGNGNNSTGGNSGQYGSYGNYGNYGNYGSYGNPPGWFGNQGGTGDPFGNLLNNGNGNNSSGSNTGSGNTGNNSSGNNSSGSNSSGSNTGSGNTGSGTSTTSDPFATLLNDMDRMLNGLFGNQGNSPSSNAPVQNLTVNPNASGGTSHSGSGAGYVTPWHATNAMLDYQLGSPGAGGAADEAANTQSGLHTVNIGASRHATGSGHQATSLADLHGHAH